MELAVSFQLYQGSTALLLGFAAGLFYDVLRTIRHRIRRKAGALCLDILYWLTLGIALFAQTMIIGQGFLQVFMLLANFCGGLLYFFVLSAVVCRALGAVADQLVRISLFLTKPMHIIWSKGRKWTGRHKKGFQKRMKHYIIRVDIYRKAKKKKKRELTGGEGSAQKQKRKRQHLHKAGRIGSHHLRIDHLDGSARSDLKRANSKNTDGAHRRRTTADQ